MMKMPPQLKTGDKVAIVAPARWPAEAHVAGLVAALKRHGLVPVVSPQVYEKEMAPDGRAGQLAGADDVRAAALNAALNDPGIKGIFFPRAGTGTYRILANVDYAALRQTPKVVVGYSDVDILLDALARQSDVATFRGPMGVNFASPDADPRTEADCFDLLMHGKRTWHWDGATVLKAGMAEGPLLGGNIATLNANIGTPFAVRAQGAILVLEECDELLFRLDRFLYQASASGLLAQVKAVLFGTLENMLDGEQHDGSGSPFGHDVPDMLRRYVPRHVPVAYGLPLGHGAYLSTHPIGANVRVVLHDTQVEMELI